MTSLKAADAKDIASSITAIANEKLKAEKEATAKKKTGKNLQFLFCTRVSCYMPRSKEENRKAWWFNSLN